MTITPIRRFFFGAAVLAAMAGFLLFPLASETERYFSWTIEPPLSAAFLGAAYWAALVLFVWAAKQREWAYARSVMPPVALIALLLLATTLIHLDRFDLDSLFGWFWLVVYCLVTPLLVVLVWRQLRESQPVARGLDPLPAMVRVLLAAQAIALLGIGSALLIAPTDAADLWPWELTPLTARAIGSFLVGFGVAAGFALWEDDVARLRGSALAYGALGALELLALAVFSGDVSGTTAETTIYAGFWTLSLALGAAGGLLSGSARRASSGSR